MENFFSLQIGLVLFMLLKIETNGYHKKWESPNNGCNPNLLASSHTTIHKPTQIHNMYSTNKLQNLKFHYWTHWFLLHKNDQ
jgi:hypothetical protein